MRLSLENLERMFHAYRYCLNNHAANAVLFGMAITALHKALGLGPVFADTRLMEKSQTLWDLLKRRRGCDAEKSLMVTWLNIVGYCVKRGFLSGGSPALAKRFFPKCGSDDYKAIDKGRQSDNSKNFQTTIPLLDACFK